MQRFLSLILLAACVVGSAPTADAQLGRLLNRAKDAVAGTADEVREAADAPPRSADGLPTPALDIVSLLDNRFFPLRGTFAGGRFFMMFPPPGSVGSDRLRARYLIRDASGREVVRTTIGQMRSTGSAAIVQLESRAGVIGDVNNAVEPGGRYTMDVELYGDVVGSIPFTVVQSSNGDPYNPVTTMSLDGPWRTHAYFEHKVERPEHVMHFHAWIAPDDIPPNTPVEVSIRRGGQEVAWGSKNAVVLTHGWSHSEFVLYTPDSRARFGRAKANVTLWTIQDVTPGEYEVVIRSEAGPFRTFTIEGAAGSFVPHPRSALDYEPRKHFLGTRQMSDQNLSTGHQRYWIAPASM